MFRKPKARNVRQRRTRDNEGGAEEGRQQDDAADVSPAEVRHGSDNSFPKSVLSFAQEEGGFRKSVLNALVLFDLAHMLLSSLLRGKCRQITEVIF